MSRRIGTYFVLLVALAGCHRPAMVLKESLRAEVEPLPRRAVARAVDGIDAEAAAILRTLDQQADPTDKLRAMNTHFFGPAGLKPLRDLTTQENTSVAAVLQNRQGTCMGLAVVYQALAERLGLRAHAVATPVHLFMRVELEDGPRNVELLEEGREIPDDIYRRRYKIAESSIERDVFLANLSDDEIIAHLLSNQAIALSREGRIDEAVARYELAIEKAPLLVAAWYNRGIDLMNVGRLDEALASFDKAIDLHPNDAQAYNNRGITKARLDDLDGARADWNAALRLDPNMTEAYENLRKLDGRGGSE